MKELDAALSGVLQSRSELETDGSSLTDTLTDTLKARQQPQVGGQFETSFTSVSAVSPQQPPPPAPRQIIALPRPPQHGGGRRRQKGSGVTFLRFTPSMLCAYTLFLIVCILCFYCSAVVVCGTLKLSNGAPYRANSITQCVNQIRMFWPHT